MKLNIIFLGRWYSKKYLMFRFRRYFVLDYFESLVDCVVVCLVLGYFPLGLQKSVSLQIYLY